jgi:hypothetical protein
MPWVNGYNIANDVELALESEAIHAVRIAWAGPASVLSQISNKSGVRRATDGRVPKLQPEVCFAVQTIMKSVAQKVSLDVD